MAEFKSWRSFVQFDRMVKGRMRYIRTPEMESLLDTVRDTAEKRIEPLPIGSSLWRAQLGCNWQTRNGKVVPAFHVGVSNSCPYEKDRMKPLRAHATEGRVNPKGIPCLYLARERATAIAEVRPWKGSYVSVALFNTRRELRIVNCVTRARSRIYLQEPSAARREKAVWAHIDGSFARPVGHTDDAADYATTQIIAELFKERGYDGIEYSSSVRKEGHNVALFDCRAADAVDGQVFYVTQVQFRFRMEGGKTIYR